MSSGIPTMERSSDTPNSNLPPEPLLKAMTVFRYFLWSFGSSLLNSNLLDSPLEISNSNFDKPFFETVLNSAIKDLIMIAETESLAQQTIERKTESLLYLTHDG